MITKYIINVNECEISNTICKIGSPQNSEIHDLYICICGHKDVFIWNNHNVSMLHENKLYPQTENTVILYPTCIESE